jgi:hypothetical protein
MGRAAFLAKGRCASALFDVVGLPAGATSLRRTQLLQRSARK